MKTKTPSHAWELVMEYLLAERKLMKSEYANRKTDRLLTWEDVERMKKNIKNAIDSLTNK